MTINSVPNILTASEREDEKTKNPSNVVTGLGYGGFAIVKGVFDGVTGIFVEPVKGGIKDGASGVFKGIGRGLIGVAAKPIGGVAGFVQCTVQGVANTPGTISKAIKKDEPDQIERAEERRTQIDQIFRERQ